ncbi:S1 family peptidase [Pseudonocardiaceae bacterium YIM PH 21723]|nr:S1 family peptidase [Pseudonocardiaceae bacterium YIM PH 21723]
MVEGPGRSRTRQQVHRPPCGCICSLHCDLEKSMNRLSFVLGSFALLTAVAVVGTQTVSTGSVAYTGDLDPALLQAYQRDLGLNEQQARETIGAETRASAIETALEQAVGDQLAGTYYDSASRRLIANVTDESTAASARKAGADVRFVQRSGKQLTATMAQLDAAEADKDITGWFIDPAANAVTVKGLNQAAIGAFLAKAGVPADSVRTVIEAERPQTHAEIVGGMEYGINGQFLCSVGFGARKGSANGFVSAGHCGDTGSKVTINGSSAGSFTQSVFPGSDYSFVTTTSSWTPTNKVNGHSQRITGQQSTAVGGSVCRSGRTTGYKCGTIKAKNQTANYAEGTVRGLTSSTACSDHGDSGGSFVTGANAQGVLSGGSANCGESLFQPIGAALSGLGATLVTS